MSQFTAYADITTMKTNLCTQTTHVALPPAMLSCGVGSRT